MTRPRLAAAFVCLALAAAAALPVAAEFVFVRGMGFDTPEPRSSGVQSALLERLRAKLRKLSQP